MISLVIGIAFKSLYLFSTDAFRQSNSQFFQSISRTLAKIIETAFKANCFKWGLTNLNFSYAFLLKSMQ